MWKFLEAAITKAWSVCIVAGSFFLFLSIYRLNGTALKPSIAEGEVQWVFLLAGIALLIASLLLYLVDNGQFTFLQSARVVPKADGVAVHYRRAQIDVSFGSVQEKAAACSERCAVVLPINNYFEARCFSDKKTSLGSFMASTFDASQIGAISRGLAKELEGELGPAPFPVGTARYTSLDGHHMIIAAVSTKQPGGGVKSEIAFLHSAMRNIMAHIVEQEIDILYLPLLGSGKGGIPHRVALASVLNALCESVDAPTGHILRQAHIIVYNKTLGMKVSELRRIVRACLSLWVADPAASDTPT